MAALVYRMEAALCCWMHNRRMASQRRGSVIDVMNRPTLASPSRPPAGSSDKGHNGRAIISRIRLPYAYSEQMISHIYRISMPLLFVPSRASRPKQFADLRPLEEAFRFRTHRKDCRPFSVGDCSGQLLEPERPRFIAEKIEPVCYPGAQDLRPLCRYGRFIIFQSHTEWLSKHIKLRAVVRTKFHDSGNLQGNSPARVIML